jgi:hypothetical protein
MVDTSVEGFNQGGSLSFRFTPEIDAGREATRVGVTVRLPVPRFMGLFAPLIQAQGRRELSAAVLEDKHDIEVRGYPRRRTPAVAGAAASMAH